jgi:hypothetical protein
MATLAERRDMYLTIDGNEAAATVAHMVNEVIAIYPITPSSAMGSWPISGRRKGGATSGGRFPWSSRCSRKAALLVLFMVRYRLAP